MACFWYHLELNWPLGAASSSFLIFNYRTILSFWVLAYIFLLLIFSTSFQVVYVFLLTQSIVKNSIQQLYQPFLRYSWIERNNSSHQLHTTKKKLLIPFEIDSCIISVVKGAPLAPGLLPGRRRPARRTQECLSPQVQPWA